MGAVPMMLGTLALPALALAQQDEFAGDPTRGQQAAQPSCSRSLVVPEAG